MKIRHDYSHLGGKEIIATRFPELKREIEHAIDSVAPLERTKMSREKTRKGRKLYAPRVLNERLKEQFRKLGWVRKRVALEIKVPGLVSTKKPFKEMDFVKGTVAVEVQLGKYFAMQYDLQKFQFFYNGGELDVGVEILLMSRLTKEMSSGVSYYEMLVGDLCRMGRTFPPVPVWVIGIDLE